MNQQRALWPKRQKINKMNNRLLHAYNHLSITNHGLVDAATVTLLMHSVAPK